MLITFKSYLGVTFDNDLKLTDHINQIVQKANFALGLYRCQIANTIRLLYTTLILGTPYARFLLHYLESSPFKEHL